MSGAPVVDHGVNRVPVVDDAGRPLGVLTRDDVLRTLAARNRAGHGRADARSAPPPPGA